MPASRRQRGNHGLLRRPLLSKRQFGHIAGVTEMTSTSGLEHLPSPFSSISPANIDGARVDVEAAINSARNLSPANLPANPTYRKVQSADSPIMIIGLTSDKYGPPKLYDEASTVIQQNSLKSKVSAQVNSWCGALPSVRVEVNPTKLASYGLSI